MKIYSIIIAAAICLGMTSAAHAAEGDYIVILKEEPKIMLAGADDGVINSSGRIYLTDSIQAAYSLAPLSAIEAVIPDETVYLHDADIQEYEDDTVNDPRRIEQWHLNHINVSSAWSNGYNGSGVRVGIVDSGIISHEDLPVPVQMYNVLDNTKPFDVTDKLGHGTKVAGIIGACTNNNIGISGVANGAELVVIKVTETSTMNTSSMLMGFQKAMDMGCNVINMSLGYTQSMAPGMVTHMEQYINRAAAEGTIVIASAGNDGAKVTGGDYQYPASYNNAISVGSLGRYTSPSGITDTIDRIASIKTDGSIQYTSFYPDEPSSFTQHNDKLDFAAPGFQIMSTNMSGGYSRSDGTSFAAPVVTAAAAIAKQMNPKLTVTQFKEAMQSTVRDVYESGYDIYTGYGALDLEKLIKYIAENYPYTPSTDAPEPTKTPEPTPQPTPTQEPTESMLVYNNGRYKLTAVHKPVSDKTPVLAALYNGDEFVGVEMIYGIDNRTISTTILKYSGEIEHVEIMAWDIYDMKPLFEKQYVKLKNGL